MTKQNEDPEKGNDPEKGTDPTTQPPNTVEELQAELQKTRAALSAANSESASRRHEIKDLEQKVKDLEQRDMDDAEKLETANKDLMAKNAAMQTRLRRYALKEAFIAEAVRKEVNWATDQAVSDAFELAFSLMSDVELDDEGKVPTKPVRDALEDVLKGRDYLIAQKKPAPNTNAQNRSSQQREVSDADLIARKRASGQYTGL
jgi:hypothetical protein